MGEVPEEFEDPPVPTTGSHEAHVEEVHDVTKGGPLRLPASPNADTGWRQAFPVTYDVVLDPPTAREEHSGE